jgi:hypothetical protein
MGATMGATNASYDLDEDWQKKIKNFKKFFKKVLTNRFICGII